MDTSDPVLERVQAAYQDLPASFHRPVARSKHHPVVLLPRRRSTALVAASVVGFVIVGAAVIGSVVSNFDNRGAVAPGASANPSESAGSSAPSASPDEAVSRALYALLDTSPDAGAYMLQLDNNTHVATLYAVAIDRALTDVLSQAASDRGYTLETKPYPSEGSVDRQDAERISHAADVLRAQAQQGQSYGFTTLKVEPALNTIVLWRTTSEPTTDHQLQDLATANGVQLELLDSPVSRADVDALANALRDQNSRWKENGFQVVGAYATGSGAVVVIKGDQHRAMTLIGSDPRVIAVIVDTTVPDKGSI